MTRPIPSSAFRTAVPAARWVAGLPGAIDAVAERAAPSHRFLRRGWFAAAEAAYGGRIETLLVEAGETPLLAMPLRRVAPGVAAVPGSYWPFRSFPAVQGADPFDAALAGLARHAAVRIGPVADDDPAAAPLLERARARGWAVLGRHHGDGWLFRLGDQHDAGAWPRNSTLRKNRFHEKHLAEHGAVEWRFVDGDAWPAAFDLLAQVEEASWIATRTDGRDAKFTRGGHGAFWRTAARDPALRAMLHGALLSIDGQPAAFSFDLDAGPVRYAIANSYDPAYAKHSPGKLLYTRNLVDAVGRGIRLVDWGMGDSGYKQVIGAEQGAALRDWLLVRPGLAARVARLGRRWWR
jgi:CelD/BcsL family acetyltransferase involved in cellulose biosynthesis